MPPEPAHQLNPVSCQADFTYTMTLDVVKIVDTGKGAKSVAPQNGRGTSRTVEWDGQEGRISN